MQRFPALCLLGFIPVIYIPGALLFLGGGVMLAAMLSISDGPDCGQPSDGAMADVAKVALLWPWLAYKDAKRQAI